MNDCYCILFLLFIVQLGCAWIPPLDSMKSSAGADYWIFDDVVPRVVRGGAHGSLYEVSLQRDEKKLSNLRPGECRHESKCRLGLLTVVRSSSLVCWHRFKVWWMRPVFGSQVPPETIMILFQDEQQQYRLIIAGDASVPSCSLRQEENGAVILTSNNENKDVARLYCGAGRDPYDLIRDGMQQVTHKHATSPVVKRSRPKTTLGWCTWNAFYTQISGSKLVKQAETLRALAPVQWMILDDGWQHTTNDEAENGQQWKERLESPLQESPSKFSDLSLRDTISQSKLLGIKDVWVWHTLMGYWLGVKDDVNLLYPHFPSGILDNDPSASREASVEKGIGIPRNCDTFFDSYHNYLKSCGVSGVKVDAQGVVGTLSAYKWGEAIMERDSSAGGGDDDDSVVSKLEKSLAGSVRSHFSQQNILHCMSHDPEIIFRLGQLYDTLPLMRASDDHYPENRHSHGPHIVACSFNALLLSHVSVPDWDMFATNLDNEMMVRLHAISRCLSGGPVYISDAPSRVKKDVVDCICCTDGTVLTCRETALPTAQCLLTDPLAHDSDPFVIFNTNGSDEHVTSGVIGVFHLAASGDWDYDKLDYGPVDTSLDPPPTRTARIRPADIPHFTQRFENGANFLALPFFSPEKAAVLPSIDSEFALDLRPLESDAIALLPIHQVESSFEMVLLGIKGKINGAGSVLGVDAGSDCVDFKVRGCGHFQFAFAPKRHPMSV